MKKVEKSKPQPKDNDNDNDINKDVLFKQQAERLASLQKAFMANNKSLLIQN